MRKPAILASVLFLGACSSTGTDFFTEAADKGLAVREDTKKALGDAIDIYCGNVPTSARVILRNEVNAYAEKGEVTVTCFDDMEEQP